jgi:hypothetical protein
MSYNASVVKIYNATSRLVRFENTNFPINFEKRSSTQQLAGVVFVGTLRSYKIGSWHKINISISKMCTLKDTLR